MKLTMEGFGDEKAKAIMKVDMTLEELKDAKAEALKEYNRLAQGPEKDQAYMKYMSVLSQIKLRRANIRNCEPS